MNNRRSKKFTQAIHISAAAGSIFLMLLLVGVLASEGFETAGAALEHPVVERPGYLYIQQNLSEVLYSVFVSESGTELWGADLLGLDVLLPGEIKEFYLPDYGPVDLLLVDAAGKRYHFAAVDVSKGLLIRVSPSDRLRPVAQQQGTGWVSIINSVGVPLRSVYVSPSGAKTWGRSVQLLSEYSLLLQDSSQHVYIDFADDNVFFFDFLAEDYYGNQYVLWDVNILLHNKIDFRIQNIR